MTSGAGVGVLFSLLFFAVWIGALVCWIVALVDARIPDHQLRARAGGPAGP